jgi:hypothetical protein
MPLYNDSIGYYDFESRLKLNDIGLELCQQLAERKEIFFCPKTII